MPRFPFALSQSKCKRVELFKLINEKEPSLTFRTVIHVLPYGHGMWQIKFESESANHSVYGTKSPAVEMARALAKNNSPSQLVVHKEDGTIEYKYTYVGDPNAPAR